MKQLDEMERMAREWSAWSEWWDRHQSDKDIDLSQEPATPITNGDAVATCDQLARALLAVMPVVRAAEAWLKQPGIDWQRTQGSAFGRANHELANAIDEMRRRLGGE